MIRGIILFVVTLPAGRAVALGATLAEMIFRAILSGLFGAATQSLRNVEPAWIGVLTAMTLLPVTGQGLEFVLHWMRHTPRLQQNTIAGVLFTVVSALFNLYAQRQGVLLAGVRDQPSLWQDLRAMPATIAGFLIFPFRR